MTLSLLRCTAAAGACPPPELLGKGEQRTPARRPHFRLRLRSCDPIPLRRWLPRAVRASMLHFAKRSHSQQPSAELEEQSNRGLRLDSRLRIGGGLWRGWGGGCAPRRARFELARQFTQFFRNFAQKLRSAPLAFRSKIVLHIAAQTRQLFVDAPAKIFEVHSGSPARR